MTYQNSIVKKRIAFLKVSGDWISWDDGRCYLPVTTTTGRSAYLVAASSFSVGDKIMAEYSHTIETGDDLYIYLKRRITL